ncbi:propionate kinase [Klebsiella quasipneumoniae]|uniref:propionate kinase n=1 Tax=Klebsiella quasipneumoniae TaxID=1463165 RepID=UPI0026502FE4|nr:propionate kinase [Klebsiella quasipneumoniae]MDN7347637.1 propionate kinase [Klebsiella quasipneumoniae]
MTEFPVVLVINCGSSSIKFSVLDAASCDCLLNGVAEGINADQASLSLNGGKPVALAPRGYEGALQAIAGALAQRDLIGSVALIGHRVAHGGDLFTESVIISEEVIDNIRQVSSLAPLHNYASLSGIASAQRLFPEVMQVAVFDTSFHQTLAPEAFLYGLPWEYYQNLGVRRYGFHGTSHRYVSRRALALLGLPEQESGLVIAHLGNGASVCAVRNGRSVDTSMGMTPLEGLMMGTRSGDVDFGAMAWIAAETRQTLNDLERVANTASDLRVLEQAWHEGHARARLAIKTFVHRIARHIAGHAAALQRLDGIIFTGGIGENSVLIRRLVSERLAVFGLEMDAARNQQPNSDGERLISADGSRVRCAVIPTNEERMIALDAIRLGRIHTAAALA